LQVRADGGCKFEQTEAASPKRAAGLGGKIRGGRGETGREEEEASVAVSPSIVPGTCAYPAPRAFERRRVHQRKERRRREEEKEETEAESDGSTLRTVRRNTEKDTLGGIGAPLREQMHAVPRASLETSLTVS